jgi:6-phosphogluconate dehydrogenase
MKIGMIGLGRMGGDMARRLMRGGHDVVGYDVDERARAAIGEDGAETADSLDMLIARLEAPRVLWMMVPAGEIVDRTIDALTARLDRGDTLVDGGNTMYKDTVRRAGAARTAGLHYLDVGTSGGVWGLREGYSLMIGGEDEVVERLRPIFEALAPSPDRGWGHVGKNGAGHFTKMIHNGIEYGIMQAYAEGFDLLAAKDDFDLDLHQVADVWRFGSVIRSWLLDLIARALADNPTLDGITARVGDSGEGRWTVQEAMDLDVSAPVITLALLHRLKSSDENHFSERLLSAMRKQFGGHAAQEP